MSPRNLESARNILNEGNLINLGHWGLPFSWIRKRKDLGVIRERLNRGAGTSNWNLLFPNATIENYITTRSDHNSIILDTSPISQFRAQPFHFEWMWTSHPDCIHYIQLGW